MVRNIDTVVIDALTPEVRVARLSQNRLVDLDIERPNRTIRAGDVILARVKAVVPSAGGAFMEIGDTSDGFLPFPVKTDRPSFHEGEAVIVQVRNEAMAEKGARLTNKVALTGRYAVYTPGRPGVNISRKGGDPALAESLKSSVSGYIPEGDGAVIRTAAFELGEGAAAVCTAEFRHLSEAWRDAQAMAAKVKPPHCLIPAPDSISRIVQGVETQHVSRIVVEGPETFGRVKQELEALSSGLSDRLELYQGVPGVFEVEGIEAQLEAALSPQVPLPSGGSLYIQETPACTTVDVDTDASRGGGRGRDIIGKTNLEAAQALAGELRLRNLSGNIVVDFIRDRDRDAGKALLDRLTASVSDDPVPVDVMGFTRLGMVELVRRRQSASLTDILLDCSADVASHLPSTETLAYRTLRHVLRAAHEAPGRKLEVRAHRSVIDLLQGNLRPAFDAVSGRVGAEVRLTGDDAIAQDKLDVFSAA